MIRSLFALFAATLLLGAAPARDWRLTTGIAPTGGFTVGNPAARVKLVEYLSYTCPHCGHFVAESKAELHDALVRNGTVMVETRSAARDPFDLAAWLLARCGGPRRFTALSSAIFAQQEAWLAKGDSYAKANLPALQAMPQMKQMRVLIDATGLGAIGARHGVTAAQLNACFAKPDDLKSVLAMTDAAFKKISGTPGFEINGTLAAGVSDWATLAPRLRAADVR